MSDLSRALVCFTVAVGMSMASPRAWAAQPEPDESGEAVDQALDDPSEAGSGEPTGEPTPGDDGLPNVDDPELEPSPDDAPAVEPPPVPEPPEQDLDPDLDQDLDQDLDEDLDQDESASIDDGYDPTRDSPEAHTARRWLGAGIGATITGAVLVGGAVAMSQTPPCKTGVGNNCFADARDRAAVTLGVPGGVLLLGGLAMTVVGALQKRRIKAGLALAPGEFGVVVAGRF
jgi:hypothetical protein